ncbi:hypothetical protein [Flagellimonas sp. 2504JD1-5]
MKRIATTLLCLFVFSVGLSQTTGNPNTGDAYLLFGPNTSWGQYLKIGGNGRGTTHASVVATNGNLHLDSRDGSYSTYINHYSQGKTLINPQSGNVGIGVTNPTAKLHVEGDGVRALRFSTSNINDRTNDSPWYGMGNSNFMGLSNDGTRTSVQLAGYYGILLKSAYGSIGIHQNGNVGIGTTGPSGKLHVFNNGNKNGLIVENSSPSMTNYGLTVNNTSTTNGHLLRLRSSAIDRVIVHGNGNVGIGTSNPGTWKLAVKGKIRAEEIKVETGWADYVFKEDYDLPTLEEVERHIKEKGHLINIPSAKEVEENGILLGEMDKLLLEKIEELTLYVIEIKKEQEMLKLENRKLKLEMDKILKK